MKLKSNCTIVKPCILRMVRNEYGKRIRKQYEKGMITEKRCNIKEYEPRPDGISNTISTVQKDNYLIEPRVTIQGAEYRIRKLTPKECFRLMGVADVNIDKIRDSDVSKTRQYKLAGNSIVVDVMVHIFGILFRGKLDKATMGTKTLASDGRPKEIIVLGNYTKANHNASRIVSPKGISPTVMENHGTVTAVIEKIGYVYPSDDQNGNM